MAKKKAPEFIQKKIDAKDKGKSPMTQATKAKMKGKGKGKPC